MAGIPVARMLFELAAPAAATTTGLAEATVSQRCGKCRSEAEILAQVEDAYTRGSAEGWERGRSERILSEQQLQTRLVDAQNARLDALAHEALVRIDGGLAGLRAEVSRTMAQALVAFFQRKIEHEATEAIATEFRHILTEHGAARVTIRGPQSWIDRLAALPEVVSGATKVEVQANDAVDVTVTIDGTVLETTIGEWLGGLGRIL